MHGLIALVVVVGWLAVSVLIARWIGKKISPEPLGMIATLILIPVLFVLPVADEIIGKFQFDRLCKEAEEVKIYGTVPVGEELYTAEGKWRRDLLVSKHGQAALNESREISKQIEKFLRYEQKHLYGLPAAIPIYGSENRVFSRNTGELVAVYRIYGTPGGWLSRKLEKPAIVRNQCLPRDLSTTALERRIFSFDLSRGTKK